MNKPAETREEIKKVQKRIADLEREANQNMNEDVSKTSFSVEELEGLPKSIVDGLADVEDKAGHKWVTLKYPDVLPTLRFAKREATREKMDFVYQNKCAEKNTPLLESLVEERHKLALLLGYNSIADYILEIRMAKNAKAV
jgi:Zn-dependent oligopeptidase